MKKFFSDEQLNKLRSKLSSDLVKTRSQAGQTLSYLEGYTAIEHANDIFGFGMWSGEVVSLTQTEAGTVEKNGKTQYRASYICVYRAQVKSPLGDDQVVFSDVGYGSGTSYSSLGDAIESAVKEAVTDAMKRTLRNFGNQFGLALYDKDQKNVERLPDIAQVNAAYKLVPEALRETAKKRMAEILSANGFTQLKEADGKTLKEVFDYFQSLSKVSG
jgi:DNA repair and recombination protein RAD52